MLKFEGLVFVSTDTFFFKAPKEALAEVSAKGSTEGSTEPTSTKAGFAHYQLPARTKIPVTPAYKNVARNPVLADLDSRYLAIKKRNPMGAPIETEMDFIEFLFSDGTTFSFAELMHAPAAYQDCLPRFLTPIFIPWAALKEKYCTDSTKSKHLEKYFFALSPFINFYKSVDGRPKWHKKPEIEREDWSWVATAFLSYLSQHYPSLEHEFPILIAFSKNYQAPRQTFVCQSLRLQKDWPLEWSLERSSKKESYGKDYWDPETYSFKKVLQERYAYKAQLQFGSGMTTEASHQQNKDATTSGYCVFASSWAIQIHDRVELILFNQPIQKLQSLDHLTLGTQSQFPVMAEMLLLEPSELQTLTQSKGFLPPITTTSIPYFLKKNIFFHLDPVVFELEAFIESEPVRFQAMNLPQIYIQALQGVKNGFKTFSKDDPKNLVLQTKGAKRDLGLKFLRHSGIFLFNLYEICYYLTYKKSSTQEHFLDEAEFLDFLFKRSIKLVMINQDADANPVQSLGPRIVQFYQNTVETLFHGLSKDFLDVVNNQLIEFKGTHHFPLAFLLSLVDTYLQTKGADIFAKESIRDFYLGSTDEEELPPYEHLNYQRLGELPSAIDLISYQIPFLKDSFFLLAELLESQGFEIYVNNERLNKLDLAQLEIKLSEDQQVDWFSLHPEIFFNGKKLQSQDLESIVKNRVLFHDGNYYLISKKDLPKAKSLNTFWEQILNNQYGKTKAANAGQLPSFLAFDLFWLKNQGFKIEGLDKVAATMKMIEQIENRQARHPDIPKYEILKSYQKEGVQWLLDLYELKLGALLCDEMGLGKTAQAICFLDILKKQHTKNKKSHGPHLIIVPSSLVYNWQSEFEKFAPSVQTQLVLSKVHMKSADEKADVWITTYGIFSENDQYFNERKWDVIIFDEAQFMKNSGSQRAKAALKIKSQFRCLLTGTPLENHIKEFITLMEISVPGSVVSPASKDIVFNPDHPGYFEYIDYLRKRLKPLICRRTKKSAQLDLPEKMESQLFIEFDQAQKDLYKKVAASYNDQVKTLIQTEGEQKAQLNMLTALLKLRQICSHPGVMDPSLVSPKLQYILEQVEEVVDSGESILIFTQFRYTLFALEKELQKLAPTFVLHGGLSSKQRSDVLNEFNTNGKPSIMVMTLKVGGVGLNLTKASYVYHMDPWWNPAVEAQATDRAHRLGQTKMVNIYKLAMRHSLEEKIFHLQKQKKKIFDILMNHEEFEKIETDKSWLSKEDFDFLLGAT